MASPFLEPSAIFSSAMTRFSEREAQPKGCGLGLAMKPLPRERRPYVPGGGKKKQRVDLSGRRHCQYCPSPDMAAFECGIISPFSST